MPAERIPIAKRFADKVKKTGGCWLWTGHLNKDGYGVLGRGGRNAGNYLAHRVAWMLVHGSIPPRMVVMHLCNQRLCVNPTHLQIGTVAENNRQMAMQRRQAVGEQTKRNKLTTKQVETIRQILKTKLLNHVQIARAFLVRRETIWKIAHHRRWKGFASIHKS